MVQLVDVDSPDAVEPADAVLLTVRADDDAPFTGLYTYMNALAVPEVLGVDAAIDACGAAAAPRCTVGSILSPSGFLYDRSPRSSRSGASSSGRMSARDRGHSEPVVFIGASDDGMAELVGSCKVPEMPRVERLDTGRVSTTSSLRERVPTVYQSLSLNTTPVKGHDPFSSHKLKRRKPSFHAAVPVAVAVTACDIVDSEEHQAAHPEHVDNLRSMAANWSNAHRCRVTFVSAKTGVGISGAIAHLIEEVFVQRRQAVREKTGGEAGATAQRVAAAAAPAAPADARSRTPKLAPPLPSAVQHMA